MPDEKKWITVAQAAKETGYSVRTIQRLIKAEKIDGWKPGYEAFTTLESVLAYKENIKQGRPPKKNK